MALLLKNLRCIDPSVGLDAVLDIAIRDGKIIEIGDNLTIPKGVIRDLKGKIAVPGLVDMHVHLRDPGEEYKEDIVSGSRAAAKGGFTAVLAMPNTRPVCDSGSRVSYLTDKAAELAKTRIYAAGAVTKGLKGESLSEMGDMVAAGAVAFTDDGRGVQDNGLMRLALDYAKQFGKPVLSHCQMEDLAGAGVVNEGVISTRLGLTGWPAAAEEIQIARDIALCQLTGCALHIQHLSTAGGVELIQAAKQKGLPVTAEVTLHHLLLNEEDIDATYNTNFKINPPLRTSQDNLALQAALASGTIDCIASDHAPHAKHQKALEFELAPFGTTGLETALGLALTQLVGQNKLSYQQMIQSMAHSPRAILGLEPVQLKVGSTADLTIIDPSLKWTVTADGWESKSANNAFIGQELQGRATDVYVAGYASLQDGEVV